MKKTVLFIFSLALLSFASCDDPSEGNLTPPTNEYPVSMWLELHSDEFSEWLELLKHADLDKTMNLNDNYTVFVPDNNAVKSYLDAQGYASIADMSKEQAILLAKYHTIRGIVYTQDQLDNGLLPDTTATGDQLSIRFVNSTLYVNDYAMITQIDQKLSNGILHAIDKVLIPITATVWDRVNTPEFSIMADAIKRAGMNEWLNSLHNLTNGAKIRNALFAVPNSVYEANDIRSADDLIAALGADMEQTDNELVRYLNYHVLSPQYTRAQLFDLEVSDASKNISTASGKDLINLSAHNSVEYINYDTTTVTGVRITEADIPAKNGIVHVIDAPMYVITPDRATVRWELTDYTEIGGLTTDYRKSGLTANTEVWLEYDKFESFKWETASPDVRDLAVKYIVYNKNDIRGHEAPEGFMNYDGLLLNLRIYGWIEMQSPLIIKGKYTVVLCHLSSASSSKSGKITMTFDGEFIGAETPTLGYSSSSAQILKTPVGTVDFAENGTHTMRILQTDASTIYIDYVEFVPAE
ncbi:MAG: fasciclin domain-containing protein [Bacteroidales bacterium]|jgi:uncharacterized surface protein with fasciclin (FAS1) repeats|nr:fasciclin domain-containing protein [Bacteroidales bacterium]